MSVLEPTSISKPTIICVSTRNFDTSLTSIVLSVLTLKGDKGRTLDVDLRFERWVLRKRIRRSIIKFYLWTTYSLKYVTF